MIFFFKVPIDGICKRIDANNDGKISKKEIKKIEKLLCVESS